MSYGTLNQAITEQIHQTGSKDRIKQVLNGQNSKEKVIQFGTGAFLRGFVDFFIQKANEHIGYEGKVVVIESTGSGRGNAFLEQNGLYTLVTEGIKNGHSVVEMELISAISRVISATDEWDKVLETALSPHIEMVVSNTTEAGIRYEKQQVREGHSPTTFPARLAAWLYHRYIHYKNPKEGGVLIIPCELIVDNGRKLKEIVLLHAADNNWGSGFSNWLEDAVAFCNSLVDRIVPGTPSGNKLIELEDQLGYSDKLLTVTEVYRLWAIECSPGLAAKVPFFSVDEGIITSVDITPFRERKLRLLNGTHTIMVAAGYLCGLNTVAECMEDADLQRFIGHVMLHEIVPSLDMNQDEATNFALEVADRFRNPFLFHQLLSISLQYSAKMKMRNVDTFARYGHKFGHSPRLMGFGFAAYLIFMKGLINAEGKYIGHRSGEAYPINDDQAGRFATEWQKTNSNDRKSIQLFTDNILSDAALWGTNLSEIPGMKENIRDDLWNILHEGPRAALKKLLEN